MHIAITGLEVAICIFNMLEIYTDICRSD